MRKYERRRNMEWRKQIWISKNLNKENRIKENRTKENNRINERMKYGSDEKEYKYKWKTNKITNSLVIENECIWYFSNENKNETIL